LISGFGIKSTRGEVPSDSLIIGRDPGSNFVVLETGGDVYYYDHTHAYPQSSEDRNAYKITNSFSEFLKILRMPE
jgi:hypothetical protein